MIRIRLLTSALRRQLKSPLGTLITGPAEDTIDALKQIVKEEKPDKIISVGDAVSSSMIENDITPNVLIVDNRIMRKKIEPIPHNASQTFHLKNPPGTLTNEAWIVIKNALRQESPTRVLVDGEEDLLALIAVLCAPENSIVVYGQPNEGIVIVTVTEQRKAVTRQIVEDMKTSTKS